jgi:hypothetical protein
VAGAAGQGLAAVQVVVAIFSHVFQDDDGHWDSAAMHAALKCKHQHVSYSGHDDGIVTCLLNCIKPKQP